jgi:hypothetical protein
MSVDWKKIVGTVAPGIATALGGPLAGLAVKALGGALGLGEGASEEAVAAAVTGANPDQLLAIKKAGQEFQVKMRELDVDLVRIAGQDRASAREVAKVNMWPHIVLSSVYTIGYFGMLYRFMTGGVEIPVDLKTEFSIVLGVMTAAQTMIMQFWFGSSSGSKEKDAMP